MLCEATTNSARGSSVRSITLAGWSESISSLPLTVKAAGGSVKKSKLAPAYIALLFSSSMNAPLNVPGSVDALNAT